jgi:hypothetical protein
MTIQLHSLLRLTCKPTRCFGCFQVLGNGEQQATRWRLLPEKFYPYYSPHARAILLNNQICCSVCLAFGPAHALLKSSTYLLLSTGAVFICHSTNHAELLESLICICRLY